MYRYLVLLLLIFSLGVAAHAEETWAVLIGIGEYRFNNQITPLPGAASDARALKRTLIQKLGVREDHIQMLVADSQSRGNGAAPGETIPNRSDILVALNRLQNQAQAGDRVWIFFAGHGVEIGGKTYLLPYDATGLSEDVLVDSALDVALVKSKVSNLAAHTRFLVFDMCRSQPRANFRGVGAEADNRLSRSTARSFDFSDTIHKPVGAANIKPPITVTWFACSPNQRSYEWQDKQRGYFSYFLEEGLRGKAAGAQGIITVNSLSSYLKSNVAQSVRRNESADQTPLPMLSGIGAGNCIVATVKPGSADLPDDKPTDTDSHPPIITDTTKNTARAEFYTNDPTIEMSINGERLKSGDIHREVIPDNTARPFQYESHGLGRTEMAGTANLSPGDVRVYQLFRLRGQVLLSRWPEPAVFLNRPAVTGSGDEGTLAKGKVSADNWELGKVHIRFADQYTQHNYAERRGIPAIDPKNPNEPQRLLIVEAEVKNNAPDTRSLYLLRCEGGETVFPYDESGAVSADGKETFPLIAHDGAAGNDLKLPIEAGKTRPVTWIFRLPKRIPDSGIALMRLSLLTVGREGETPTRTLFEIRRKTSSGKSEMTPDTATPQPVFNIPTIRHKKRS